MQDDSGIFGASSVSNRCNVILYMAEQGECIPLAFDPAPSVKIGYVGDKEHAERICTLLNQWIEEQEGVVPTRDVEEKFNELKEQVA